MASSQCYSHALRKLGLRPAGGNHRVFRWYVDVVWKISTSHFDRAAAGKLHLARPAKPLEDVLVTGSGYRRGALKNRLYAAGLKTRRCELCGQGEEWRGGRMSLILDHINGIPDDNRLVNLRILCPNCAATFDTHCGRKNTIPVKPRECLLCGRHFSPKYAHQHYCSQACGTRHTNRRREPRPENRKVRRPTYEELITRMRTSSVCAIARDLGVSHSAVRKWLRAYRDAQT